MPLPEKSKNEQKSKFMSRCLSDSKTRKEFPDVKQRIAVCLNQFKNKKKQ